MSLRPSRDTGNSARPRRSRPRTRARFRLCYRRERWLLTTAPKFKRFDTLEEAMAFVRRLQRWERTTGGKLLGLLEERDAHARHGWREIPISDGAR